MKQCTCETKTTKHIFNYSIRCNLTFCNLTPHGGESATVHYCNKTVKPVYAPMYGVILIYKNQDWSSLLFKSNHHFI